MCQIPGISRLPRCVVYDTRYQVLYYVDTSILVHMFWPPLLLNLLLLLCRRRRRRRYCYCCCCCSSSSSSSSGQLPFGVSGWLLCCVSFAQRVCAISDPDRLVVVKIRGSCDWVASGRPRRRDLATSLALCVRPRRGRTRTRARPSRLRTIAGRKPRDETSPTGGEMAEKRL